MEKIDVITLVYNRFAVVKQSIEWMKRDPGMKIRLIAVDDGSTEEGLNSWLQSNVDLLVNLKQNVGISKALNKAAAMTSGEWFIVIDSDTLVPSHYAKRMLEEVEKHKKVYPKLAWMGFKVLKPDKTMQFYYRDLDDYGESLQMPGSDPKAVENNELHITTAPAAPAYIMNREAFLNIGMADGNLKRQWIDADIGMKLKHKGYVAMANPNISFVHTSQHTGTQLDVIDHDYFKSKWRKRE